METKTKYQYSYFIYPYIVEEKKYEKHLYKLLTNRNCKIKQFNPKEEQQIFSFFLPKVRDYMFGNLGMNKLKKKKLEEFDKKMQAVLLEKYPCSIFEYEINKNVQGKTGYEEGIFFNIKKVEIVCFKPGICFLLIKTMLNEQSTLQELCDFNYKFRDINGLDSEQFKDIKIQTDSFQDVRGIQEFIKDITGNNRGARELNIDTERFITYSYACIEKKDWNLETIGAEFNKFANIESSNCQFRPKVPVQLSLEQNVKFGFINSGTVLLTSDTNVENYTSLPEKYEREYLYSYIFELYKKYYLKKLSLDFEMQDKFKETKEHFVNFTQSLMIEEISDEGLGTELIACWKEITNVNDAFAHTKQKYDLLYKNINIENVAKSNKIIAIVLIAMVIINIINSINLFG